MVSHRSTVAVSVAIIATLLFPYVSSYADTIESMNDSDMKFITSVVSSGDEFLG